jgi:hypothetical protein
MTNIPTRPARLGLTRGRLALLALLVLGSTACAATYVMREPAPPPSAESRQPPSAAGTPASTESARPSAVPRSERSASRLPSTSTGTSAPQQRSPAAPDSAVNPDSVFVDPASVIQTPPRDGSTPPACGQWQSLLSDEQRTSYSMTLLRAAWKNDGSARIPPESTVRSYRSAITAACLGTGTADDNVPDVARVVYAADPGKWGP